jgi:hypothetical protein
MPLLNASGLPGRKSSVYLRKKKTSRGEQQFLPRRGSLERSDFA